MIDPADILTTALRTAMINSTAVTALVAPDQIRAGSTVPERFPSIILGSPQMINLGRAAGGQYATRCFVDVHVWADDNDAQTARQIGAELTTLLWDEPVMQDAYCAEYQRPSLRYIRDPDPSREDCHGVGTVEAVLYWSV